MVEYFFYTVITKFFSQTMCYGRRTSRYRGNRQFLSLPRRVFYRYITQLLLPRTNYTLHREESCGERHEMRLGDKQRTLSHAREEKENASLRYRSSIKLRSVSGKSGIAISSLRATSNYDIE